VSLIERGHLDTLSVRTLRAVLGAVEARLEVNVFWRGGAIDRLTDERHAGLVEIVVRRVKREGWRANIEVSYGRYRETGSIDVLAWHERSRSLLVIEVKSEITSVEETLRKHDEKVRFGAAIARERYAWRPLTVSRLLVLPEGATPRRRVGNHVALFEASYPSRTLEVLRWLRRPSGVLAGIAFLATSHERMGRATRAGVSSRTSSTAAVTTTGGSPPDSSVHA
jgi:hypothetical protein